MKEIAVIFVLIDNKLRKEKKYQSHSLLTVMNINVFKFIKERSITCSYIWHINKSNVCIGKTQIL